MCSKRKQFLIAVLLVALGRWFAPAWAGELPQAVGGAALGDSRGGITDRAYVVAPPRWVYVVEREPGSFLDCGTGMDVRLTDADGRDAPALACGVTLTETLAIPAAAESARIVIHY